MIQNTKAKARLANALHNASVGRFGVENMLPSLMDTKAPCAAAVHNRRA
jgi:hypothetical protein